MYAKSPRIVQSANSYFQDSKCTLMISAAGWFGVSMDFIIECKITPGMELFEQQYFTEQYIALTRTEEGHEKD